MRAVIYARYFRPAERRLDRHQIEVCRRYAKAQNWEVVDCYIDRRPKRRQRVQASISEATCRCRQLPL